MQLFHHLPADHPPHTWYQKEETANAITHFLAFLLALIGFLFLLLHVNQLNNTRVLVACWIYAISVSVTFLASAIYHFTDNPKYKHFFHICDHMVIYVMIAGTYTPFTLITLSGVWGWSLFAAIWTLTAIGFIFKLFFIGRFQILSTATYVLMGWMGVIAIVPIIAALPAAGLYWLILGGACYTLGVVFYLMQTVPFAHTVWHLFVMAGALTQFICIYEYVAIK